jgi:PAS domain S-box-containing protein
MRSLLFVAADELLRHLVLLVARDIGWREGGPDDDVDLILVDVEVANPDGAAAAVSRARNDHDKPVVVLAERLSPELLDATPHASGYALKPPSARELEAVFATALRRHANERASSTRERWLRSALRCMVDGVITTDENGRVTFMNPAAERLTGFREDDARGQLLDDVFHAVPDNVDTAASDGDGGSAPVLRLEQRNGGAFVIEHNSSALMDERGALLGVVVVFRDIGERRRTEQRSAHERHQAALARVLVVDDEPMIGTAIRRILAKQGVDVVVESEARRALARIQARESFDVVLCDLMMPGFSGFDLYDAVTHSAPALATRFVFMTGNAFTPKAAELFESTTNLRLEKPFVPADLTRAVIEVMRRHGVELHLSS